MDGRKYGEKSHATRSWTLSADDEAPEPPAQPEDGGENDAEKPVRSHVVIVSERRKGQHPRGQRHAVWAHHPACTGYDAGLWATAQNGWERRCGQRGSAGCLENIAV